MPTCILRESTWISVSLSWFLDLLYWLMILSFIWWGIVGLPLPSWEILGGAWLKNTEEYAPKWKYWGWGWLKERHQGLLSCRILSGLGWVVKWEPDLMLFFFFFQFHCLNRIFQDKGEDIAWELCSKEKRQDFSWPVMAFLGDWEIYQIDRDQWLHREIHSLIKTLAHPKVTN